MGTLEYKIGATNLTKEERVFQQNHKMLWPENYYYYEYCKGGKTGYTDQAKTTLVTMADNGDMRLSAVVLYDYGVDAYTDTRGMFDYVFQNFHKVPVAGQEESEEIASFDDKDAYVVLPEGVAYTDLEKEIVLTKQGIRSGRILYTYKGDTVGNADITLTEDGYQKLSGGDAAKSDSTKIENEGSTPEKSDSENQDKAKASEGSDQDNQTLKLVIAVSAAVIFAAILIIAVVEAVRKRKRRKK